MIRTFDESKFVEIVGDGAIATDNIQAGRLLPTLILGCAARRDIADLIRLHVGATPGDVISTWVREKWPGPTIALHLKFIRPTPGEAMIRFDLPKHLVLLDSLIHNHACYLQADDHGTKLSNAFSGVPRILAEIPAEGLPFDWDKEFENYLYKQFRNEGLSRQSAKAAAKTAKNTSREIWKLRKNRGP